jgi:RHS repeat-associated protein
VYDADGNRIVRTDDTGTTVYLGGQEILIESDGAVSTTRYCAFAGSGTVAVRTDRGLGNGVTSLVNDHHGTPVAAVSNGTHPKQASNGRLYTDPYGARRGTSEVGTVPGDAQFLGKTRDESTGLTQVGARYYDEQIGRFISVDPLLVLTDPQQWNPYAYASNSPVSLSDPSGLAAVGATDREDTNGKSMGGQKSIPTKTPLAVQTVDPPISDASIIAAPVAVAAAPWLEGLIAAISWAAVGSAAAIAAAAGGVLMMCGSTTGGCANDDASLSEQSTPAPPPDDHDCLPAFTLCSGDEPADAIDAIVETIDEGTCAASTWENITNKGATPNVRTGTTKKDFIELLIDAGWTHEKTGLNNQIDLLKKNGARYSVRDVNDSNHDGPTAEFIPAGAKNAALKIRMAW